MVTKKDIMRLFAVKSDAVKQIGSKQLFIVDTKSGRMLVSYRTIIGYFTNSIWHISSNKYTVTTSKQTSQFINSTKFTCIRCSEEELQAMVRQTQA